MMQKSDSIAALGKALSAFQGEIRAAPKTEKNPFYSSRYADLATVWETIRGPLAAHGLSVSQLPAWDANKLILTTLLIHDSGEWLSSELVMVPMKEVKGTGWIESMDPQSVGKALTYARRYGVTAMLGVVADDDDDGNKASISGLEQEQAGRMPVATAIAVSAKGFCPVHHVPFQHRQGAGAKGPYDFWACPERIGAGFCKEKPREDTNTGGAALQIPDTTPDAITSSPSASATPAAPPTPKTLGDLMAWARAQTPSRDSRATLAELLAAGWTRPDGKEPKAVSDMVSNTPADVDRAFRSLAAAWHQRGTALEDQR